MDGSIQFLNNWGLINHYPLDSAIGFPNTYPLDSDLSCGERYPSFEQPGPDRQSNTMIQAMSVQNGISDSAV